MTTQQQKARNYLRATKKKQLEALKAEIATSNKPSASIRIATRQHSYNNKVRAYAKKHKVTLQKATIALMNTSSTTPIKENSMSLENVFNRMCPEAHKDSTSKKYSYLGYTNEVYIDINYLLNNDIPLQPHARKFLDNLRQNFGIYSELSEKQYKWYWALKQQYIIED